MTHKNILIFCPREVNVNMGGIERVTDTLARFLINKGYNVVFMSVEHTCSEEYKCVAPQYFTKKSGNIEWILSIIKKHEITLIINQMGLFKYCSKTSLPSNVKVITVMHDSYYAMYQRLQLNFLRKWNWKRVMKKSMQNIYEQSDKIVVFVPPFVNEYQYFFPKAKTEKFVVIPNTNSFNCVQQHPKEKMVVWVGRHSNWHKRTTDILKIWSKIESRFPNWKLYILGDGPDGNEVRRLHSSLSLKNCYICGVVDPNPFYEKASILCVTSAFESFGMILTEGMQYGCVPITYDSYTAVRYIINDGRDGILVTPFDLDEYAEKLSHLMEDEEMRHRLSKAAIESVKQYDAENVMPKWLELIESI